MKETLIEFFLENAFWEDDSVRPRIYAIIKLIDPIVKGLRKTDPLSGISKLYKWMAFFLPQIFIRVHVFKEIKR